MQVYVSGNKVTDSKGNAKLSPSDDAWKKGYVQTYIKTEQDQRHDTPIYPSYVEIQSADEAYASVLADVGANAQGIDYLDARYLSETKNGTYTYTGSVDKLKGIIDSQNDVGGYPTSAQFKGGTAYTDSDSDGISDEWETAHGLNPNDAKDGNLVTLSEEGYTNVELFLNELAGDTVRVSVKAEPIDGTLIRQLDIRDSANRASWQLAESVRTGDAVFGDRDVVYTALPAVLEGAEYIRTACDSKNTTGTLAVFEAGADCTVYAAFDSRVETLPSWVSGWEKTSLTAENDRGVSFVLYRKNVQTGETVTLGANGQSQGCVNYTVFAVTDTGSIAGDVNADGTCDVRDVVMLQKWLLCAGDLTDRQAGDLCADGVIDVFDLCMMKRMLLQ